MGNANARSGDDFQWVDQILRAGGVGSEEGSEEGSDEYSNLLLEKTNELLGESSEEYTNLQNYQNETEGVNDKEWLDFVKLRHERSQRTLEQTNEKIRKIQEKKEIQEGSETEGVTDKEWTNYLASYKRMQEAQQAEARQQEEMNETKARQAEARQQRAAFTPDEIENYDEIENIVSGRRRRPDSRHYKTAEDPTELDYKTAKDPTELDYKTAEDPTELEGKAFSQQPDALIDAELNYILQDNMLWFLVGFCVVFVVTVILAYCWRFGDSNKSDNTVNRCIKEKNACDVAAKPISLIDVSVFEFYERYISLPVKAVLITLLLLLVIFIIKDRRRKPIFIIKGRQRFRMKDIPKSSTRRRTEYIALFVVASVALTEFVSHITIQQFVGYELKLKSCSAALEACKKEIQQNNKLRENKRTNSIVAGVIGIALALFIVLYIRLGLVRVPAPA